MQSLLSRHTQQRCLLPKGSASMEPSCARSMVSMQYFYLLFLTPPALLAQATQSAPATPVPTAPVISGTVTTSSYTISGTAEKTDGITYKTIAIYVCSTPTKPGVKPTDCSSKSATDPGVTASALTNSEPVASGTANYVLADKNGNFAAILTDNLKAGRYVYITEVATNAVGAGISNFSNAATVVTTATTQCNKHPLRRLCTSSAS